MEKQLEAMFVSDRPAAPAAQKLGTAPLAAKKTRNVERGTKRSNRISQFTSTLCK
ncbi:Piwi domain-containing protein [Caenorhabditis elegans]|uniref:Piwi domain-containing protein n=1 Tax=Caenorhabditis elegans TaxID=6239 RepID=Q8IG64_CAEEL|nr:Piwi domain-containing protein [Caenorhabditis elegans]CCD65143.1 Piwi domain-containing protein [Caenorhabditis elegans]|eukprot:NP_740836.1 PAZ/PIWI domain-containing [Caenorhabditis elegans]